MRLDKLIPTLAVSVLFVSPTVSTWAWQTSDFLPMANNTVEISLNLPAAPGGGGLNTGTVAGGRRSPQNLCTDHNQPPLTMLMSQEINHIQVSEASDQNQNVSFYWYLPETNAKKAEFFLITKDGDFLYSQEFEIPQNQKGLVRLDLPNDLKFEKDEVYKWELALVCQEFDRSSDEYVWGAVQPLTLEQQVEINNELKSAQFNPAVENADSLEEAIANVYLRYKLWSQAIDLFAQSPEPNLSAPLGEILEYFNLQPEIPLIGIVNQDGFLLLEN